MTMSKEQRQVGERILCLNCLVVSRSCAMDVERFIEKRRPGRNLAIGGEMSDAISVKRWEVCLSLCVSKGAARSQVFCWLC